MLSMTPINPTFIEARDAILQADCATNACANEALDLGRLRRPRPRLRRRGSLPGQRALPRPATRRSTSRSRALPRRRQSAHRRHGRRQRRQQQRRHRSGRAGQATVKLTNPWRGAGKAVGERHGDPQHLDARRSPSTTTRSTYGAIAPQGTATGDTFLITVDPSVACGSAIDFTLTTVVEPRHHLDHLPGPPGQPQRHRSGRHLHRRSEPGPHDRGQPAARRLPPDHRHRRLRDRRPQLPRRQPHPPRPSATSR